MLLEVMKTIHTSSDLNTRGVVNLTARLLRRKPSDVLAALARVDAKIARARRQDVLALK